MPLFAAALRGEFGKHACAGAGHCRHPGIVELLEPFQMARHLADKSGIPRAQDRYAPCSTEKGGILIGIVFRVNSLLPKTCAVEHVDGGRQDEIPGGRQCDSGKFFAHPFSKRVFTENEHWHIRPQSQPQLQ